MEENKNLDSLLEINPEEFITKIQELVIKNKKGYKEKVEQKEKFKQSAKKVRPRKKIKKITPAVFGANLNFLSNNKKEIILSSYVDPNIINLNKDLIKSDSTLTPEDLVIKGNFFYTLDHGPSGNVNIIHPYTDIIDNSEITDKSSFKLYKKDENYLYNPEYIEGLHKYSDPIINPDSKNKLIFYRGNLYLNGLCYGTYTGYLENKAEIDLLKYQLKEYKTQIESLKTEIDKLKESSTKAIYRSELDYNNEKISYIWAGTEENYNNLEKDDSTIFITSEE